MVGLDINEVNRNEHLQGQLEFVSGLGQNKALLLLERLREDSTDILSRGRIAAALSSEVVSKNCCPFLKI